MTPWLVPLRSTTLLLLAIARIGQHYVAKLCWNQRVVDRKRDLAPWLLNYSRGKRPKPTTTTDIAPVVWTSSYDARKYSNIDYTV